MSETQRPDAGRDGLGLFMVFLDVMIVNVGLPAIQASFGIGESGLQWVVTGYSLGMAVSIMSSATFADLHGRASSTSRASRCSRVLSLAAAWPPSLGMLTAARVVQGLAAAATNVTSLALVSAAFPEPKQGARDRHLDRDRLLGAPRSARRSAACWSERSPGARSSSSTCPSASSVLALTWRYVAESRDKRPRQFDIPGQLAVHRHRRSVRLRRDRRPARRLGEPAHPALLASRSSAPPRSS
jgi:hypothetical protein